MADNIVQHDSDLTRLTRAAARGQHGFTLWFTGISGSGKSTIAVALEHELVEKRKLAAFRLDGDNIRAGLNKGLGFTPQDRTENIRRIGEVAKLFADSGAIAITSFISPYAADRDAARKLHDLSPAEKESGETPLPFIEVYIDVPLEVAMDRDIKGLYGMADKGLIQNFTGVSSTSTKPQGGKSGSGYEPPENPELHIKNDNSMEIPDAVKTIIEYLEKRGLLDSPPDIETAKAESAKLVEAGQALKEARLVKEQAESAEALKAAEAAATATAAKAAEAATAAEEASAKAAEAVKAAEVAEALKNATAAEAAEAAKVLQAAQLKAFKADGVIKAFKGAQAARAAKAEAEDTKTAN
ncbi:Adenylyl-sulfate kinase [Microsporum canis]|uniref:Adenylyl-sulfate kinase n=1 Tax=Arthroderma otae (strain ATCC MYA-4605 / CBS 113480) TaxID=554155 RepID=C5FHK5_ARTOC|nr:adenylyl-sulfate kinase [Microsporum canis CBS 113480]EEQ28745.1 adenylyl-sulfate kinase [Microsporum canis CBS 113480]